MVQSAAKSMQQAARYKADTAVCRRKKSAEKQSLMMIRRLELPLLRYFASTIGIGLQFWQSNQLSRLQADDYASNKTNISARMSAT